MISQALKKTSDFKRVYGNGKSLANRSLVMYVLRNGQDYNRLGVSVSKKVGKANVRNKVRRRIKESYRLTESALPGGADIVIIARVAAKSALFAEIDRSVKDLIKRHAWNR
ncbi:MAG: ribonuclease P protein component [Clostridiales bacterium]|jgi:ribonuclease P protein component|nr:ribonuclease P protein component [Clostridiales bacterium]